MSQIQESRDLKKFLCVNPLIADGKQTICQILPCGTLSDIGIPLTPRVQKALLHLFLHCYQGWSQAKGWRKLASESWGPLGTSFLCTKLSQIEQRPQKIPPTSSNISSRFIKRAGNFKRQILNPVCPDISRKTSEICTWKHPMQSLKGAHQSFIMEIRGQPNSRSVRQEEGCTPGDSSAQQDLWDQVLSLRMQ